MLTREAIRRVGVTITSKFKRSYNDRDEQFQETRLLKRGYPLFPKYYNHLTYPPNDPILPLNSPNPKLGQNEFSLQRINLSMKQYPKPLHFLHFLLLKVIESPNSMIISISGNGCGLDRTPMHNLRK